MHGQHDLIQDVAAGLVGLVEGFLDDVVGQAVVLEVHLDGGDALPGAADLEVHLAVEVLHALNVEHGHPAVALGDQAAGDAGTGALMGTPASISASVEPQMEPERWSRWRTAPRTPQRMA